MTAKDRGMDGYLAVAFVARRKAYETAKPAKDVEKFENVIREVLDSSHDGVITVHNLRRPCRAESKFGVSDPSIYSYVLPSDNIGKYHVETDNQFEDAIRGYIVSAR